MEYAGIACIDGNSQRESFLPGESSSVADPPHSQAQVRLFQHDATQSFGTSPSGDGRPLNVDVVVANPPWGKNIGVGEDAFRIVHNVAAAFPNATAGYIVSEWTFKQLHDIARRQNAAGLFSGIELMESVRVGAQWLVVVRSSNRSA